MKKLILPSMITFFFITGIEVHADGHASNNGEGAFNTLMVKSKDIETVSYTHLTLPTIYSV